MAFSEIKSTDLSNQLEVTGGGTDFQIGSKWNLEIMFLEPDRELDPEPGLQMGLGLSGLQGWGGSGEHRGGLGRRQEGQRQEPTEHAPPREPAGARGPSPRAEPAARGLGGRQRLLRSLDDWASRAQR